MPPGLVSSSSDREVAGLGGSDGESTSDEESDVEKGSQRVVEKAASRTSIQAATLSGAATGLPPEGPTDELVLKCLFFGQTSKEVP